MAVDWRGQKVAARTVQAAESGLYLAAEHVLNVSNRVVPHETGDLERSGIAQSESGHAVVSYDTPYAVVQHERMDYTHSAGRHAKYLESAVDSNAEVAQQLVASSIRRVIGG